MIPINTGTIMLFTQQWQESQERSNVSHLVGNQCRDEEKGGSTDEKHGIHGKTHDLGSHLSESPRKTHYLKVVGIMMTQATLYYVSMIML